MAETMKAAVLHGKEDLRIERVAMPVAGPGELVLRVETALTCGTDLKVFRRGYHDKMLTPDRLFGHEVAGVVAEAGAGVSQFRLGDRVVPLNSAPCDKCFFCHYGQQNLCDDLLFNNGAYAEFIRVPARIVAKNTLKIPAGMPSEHAALTEPLACVMRGIEESQVRAGQNVIVLGAGPIGLLFIHALSLEGAEVVAVVKRSDQIATAMQFGAKHVVRLADVGDPVAAARALTPNGRGADVVFEAVATTQAWEWAVSMVRKGGLVNLFGGPPADTKVQLDTNLIHYSDITLKASFHHTPATARRAFELLCSGRFRCADFITGTAALADVPEVFARMMVRPADGIAPEIKTAILPMRVGAPAANEALAEAVR